MMHPAHRESTTGFGRFVTTRGCAYLLLPSMTALRRMAGLGGDRVTAAASATTG